MTKINPIKPPATDLIERIIATALAEDTGPGNGMGDITSKLLIPGTTQAQMLFVAREGVIACGTFIPAMVYRQLGAKISVEQQAEEGGLVPVGGILAKVTGPAQAILTGERVALNLMQRMCGVATLTHVFVDAVSGTKAVILDTRKTMPGLRELDKYAVRAGGGQNHRMGLYDMVMIKDNHIALAGNIADAVRKARAGTKLMIEVECDTLEQVAEAVDSQSNSILADRILLDNMDVATLRRAVKLVAGRIPLEASGGVTLDTVRAIAQTGVDYISVGKLTHSAPAADIGADIVIDS